MLSCGATGVEGEVGGEREQEEQGVQGGTSQRIALVSDCAQNT